MSGTNVRRIVLKLAVLVAMIGALFLYRSDTRAQFGSTGCDNGFQQCYTQCIAEGNSHEQCVSGECASGYFTCWDNENPPKAEPQLPCPPCVAECDFNQQVCLAEGGLSPQQCAFIAYRCKQRCNYGCFY